MLTHLATLVSLLAAPQEPPPITFADAPARVTTIAGPLLLHADIDMQWGGSTLSYLLEGERGVFWSAKAAREGPALVGQYPRPGSDLETVVTALPGLDEPVELASQPQLLRTPDGHLHAFLGYEPMRDNDGRLHYYRTARPEDVRAWVDATHRLPTSRFDTFASSRKNVGISRDGDRAVLVVMTAFKRNHYSRNTPLVFLGRRDGLDFAFAEPVAFAEPTPFFYPLVAATRHGPVLVGAVDHDPSRHAELVHLDWQGRVLGWHKLPIPDVPARTTAFELEPLDEGDWSQLLVGRTVRPLDGGARALELWHYDAAERQLRLARSFAWQPGSGVDDVTSAGQLLVVPGRPPLFLNEPSSRAVVAWEGDLLGESPLRLAPLPRTCVSDFGYRSIRSVFLPSVLQGSMPPRGPRALAVDLAGPGMREGDTAPCSWLLWWVAY